MARFEQLRVWQAARGAAKDIYEATRGWQGHSALKHQLQRAADSVPANIAEGCDNGSDAQLRRFLHIARGSCGEARSHLYLAMDRRVLDPAAAERLLRTMDHIGRMLGAFIVRLGP